MEFLFEFIIELLLEGTIDISSNQSISKWIRYPLIFVLVVFFSAVILFLFILGIYLYKESKTASLAFIALSIFFLIGSILKFKKLYFEKKDKTTTK